MVNTTSAIASIKLTINALTIGSPRMGFRGAAAQPVLILSFVKGPGHIKAKSYSESIPYSKGLHLPPRLFSQKPQLRQNLTATN